MQWASLDFLLVRYSSPGPSYLSQNSTMLFCLGLPRQTITVWSQFAIIESLWVRYYIRAVAHQAAGRHKFRSIINRGNRVTGCQR
jgi:hypothetical protein